MFMGAVCARSPRARRGGLRRVRNALKFFSQSPACRGTARCAPRVKADRERVSEFSEGEGADSFCGAENLKISNFGREITWDGNPLRLIA